MIKFSFFLIFILTSLINANTYQMYNFSINPTESQPSGSINSNHIFFRKNKKYQKYQIKKNNNIDFGKKITFSLLNDLCYNDFEKNNVINCLKNIQMNGGVFMIIVLVLLKIV